MASRTSKPAGKLNSKVEKSPTQGSMKNAKAAAKSKVHKPHPPEAARPKALPKPMVKSPPRTPPEAMAPRALAPKAPVVVEPLVPAAHSTPRMPETLADRYALVQDKIAQAAARAGRRARDIMLVAVTKNAEPEQIKSLLQLGHRDFGENRVQVLIQHAAVVDEFVARQRLVPSAAKLALAPSGGLLDASSPASDAVRWHMIGHLQRNKAKKIIELVRLVHSVDSLRIAEELQTLAIKKDRVVEVLLQVNCSGEEQKYGCPFPAAIRLAEQIGEMVNIRLRGLMTMAAYSERPEEARPAFARCRELFEEMRTMKLTDGEFNILSMGMSGDYEVAISEGANVVRVGSAIFGEAVSPRPDELPEEDEE